MYGNDIDFITPPWWGGTVSGTDNDWTDDYTRSRSGIEPTYSGVDAIIGRTKTGRELDKDKY